MPLPPAFEDRSPVEQIIGAVVVTMVFGILCGFALGWNEIAYYILAVPIAIAGGFLGGIEHRSADDGLVRGAIGGLVFVTTIVGGILGALGAAYRMRRERELGVDAAAPPASG